MINIKLLHFCVLFLICKATNSAVITDDFLLINGTIKLNLKRLHIPDMVDKCTEDILVQFYDESTKGKEIYENLIKFIEI